MSAEAPRRSVGTADPGPRLALALDVDDLETARRLARRLAAYFPVAKIGLELFAAAGAAAVAALREDGFEVFLDVKLHDIPTTVHRTARVLGRLGPRYVTLHAQGGAAMLAAGVEGLGAGAAEAGEGPCGALGVTVLTSEPVAAATVVAERAARASEAGCAGIVCAATDLPAVAGLPDDLLRVVPGVRLAGAETQDQGRPTAPGAAVAAGAGLLVVGRAVTAAPDPVEAATAVVAAVADAGGRVYKEVTEKS